MKYPKRNGDDDEDYQARIDAYDAIDWYDDWRDNQDDK